MTGAHTPGPWAVPVRDGTPLVSANSNADGSPVDGEAKNGGIYIARVQGPDAAANARLIAAAPDLLAALETFVAEYVELVDSGDAGFWNAEAEPKVKAARAAIARATSKEASHG